MRLLTIILCAIPCASWASIPELQIEDLRVVEESGVPPAEFRQLMSTASGATTYPNTVYNGYSPNSYIGGTYPNVVTAGDTPGGMNHGNFPNSYTGSVFSPLGSASGVLPQPELAIDPE